MSIRSHIRSNIVGYIALCVAMSGTAIALPGKNTVDSRDIINGQVKTRDLGSAAVTSRKLATGAVGTEKVLDDSLTATDIADDGGLGSAEISELSGLDVIDGSLGGADIAESSLGQVPSAVLGGLGRTSARSFPREDGGCDPESTTFVTCASVGLSLPAQTRVLLIGNISADAEPDAESGFGNCRLGTSRTGGLTGTQMLVGSRHETGDIENVTLLGVTPLLAPGPVSFGVDCNQLTTGAITYYEGAITAIAISPN